MTWPGLCRPKTKKQIGWSSIKYLWDKTSIPFDKEACAYGITYDTSGNRLFVTGKLWPKVYEIQLVPGNPK
ncbi:MAG: glutaminyl-peptide cyclotransferase [Methanomicrobiales archaeon]